MEPECAKSAAKIAKKTPNRPKWLPDGFQDPHTKFKYPILVDFWLPQGTPKSTKNGTLGESGGPRAGIFAIFAEKGAATHFFINLSSMFD